MKEALRTLLLADPSVAALAGTRVDWAANEQGLRNPRIVMFVISGNEGLVMSGRDGILENRVQIDCYANEADGAEDLARAVVNLLHCYRQGSMRFIQHVGSRDGREGGTNEADRPYFVRLDFLTSWRT